MIDFLFKYLVISFVSHLPLLSTDSLNRTVFATELAFSEMVLFPKSFNKMRGGRERKKDRKLVSLKEIEAIFFSLF